MIKNVLTLRTPKEKVETSLPPFQILWKGKDVFSLSIDKLWEIQSILRAEGQKATSLCDKTQFPKYEASAMEVVAAVAVYKQYKYKLQTKEELYAIINLYKNSDKRLIKIGLN